MQKLRYVKVGSYCGAGSSSRLAPILVASGPLLPKSDFVDDDVRVAGEESPEIYLDWLAVPFWV